MKENKNFADKLMGNFYSSEDGLVQESKEKFDYPIYTNFAYALISGGCDIEGIVKKNTKKSTLIVDISSLVKDSILGGMA